jgi:hypothetical protein
MSINNAKKNCYLLGGGGGGANAVKLVLKNGIGGNKN